MQLKGGDPEIRLAFRELLIFETNSVANLVPFSVKCPTGGMRAEMRDARLTPLMHLPQMRISSAHTKLIPPYFKPLNARWFTAEMQSILASCLRRGSYFRKNLQQAVGRSMPCGFRFFRHSVDSEPDPRIPYFLTLYCNFARK
jgi:hypothetical protein